MTEAVPSGRLKRAGHQSKHKHSTRTWFALHVLLLVLASGCWLHAQVNTNTMDQPGVPAQTAAPQIITVPVPSYPPGYVSNGTDWSRAGGAATPARAVSQADSARASAVLVPDVPTPFQVLVRQTTGRVLPVFGANLFSNPPSTFAPVQDAQVTQDYILGPGDEIRISATGQLNQQGNFTVDRAGTITIPNVGTLTVAGLRFSQLQPFLRQQIGRVYRNFDLNVTLGQLRSIQVYIVGEARQPGAYTVSSLSTLVNALFASGGVLPQGSLRRIELQRGGQAVTTLDLYDLLLRGDKSRDVKLQPGDVIFVPTAGPQIALIGSVTNQAIYELRGETTLEQVLQLANGLTSTANSGRIRVESVSTDAARSVQNITLATSNAVNIHGGDIITIDAISDQFRNAITLRGNVANPGRYAWHQGIRVSDLLPNRDALITRNYFQARNALSQTGAGSEALSRQSAQANPQNVQQGQTGDTALNLNSPPAFGPATVPSTGSGQPQGTSLPLQAPPSASAVNTTSSSGGGATVGDALTQNNGAFPIANTVVLSAPDVDLSYAVIERLDPVTLSTSLLPFNLGRILDGSDASQNLVLQPGDVVTVFSKADIRVPQSQQTRFVRLEGEFVSAGVYSVLPGETLRQLILRAGGLSRDAYLYASEFTRQSTRRVEQQRLNEYADSLEAQISAETNREITGAIGVSGDAANAVRAGADAARAAVERLRATPPTGRIVLKLSPASSTVESIPDIALEDGDRFIVPRQPSSVSVTGEVYNASAFLFAPDQEIRNYLRTAGGPSRYADAKRVFVIRADGSIVSQQYGNVLKAPSLPGDTIVVPPQLARGNVFREILAFSSIAGQLAAPLTLFALLR